MTQVVLFNKPFNVLCQFTDTENRQTLKDFINIPNVYPAGRLDKDSEGLLILTDDGAFQHKIAHPINKTKKTYWALVEGVPNQDAIEKLRKGVELKDGFTLPAECSIMETPDIEPRVPPVRFRKTITDTWISITIQEGKNRQVRRMCAAVGFPVLRLIRYQIGSWTLDDIKSGEFKAFTL